MDHIWFSLAFMVFCRNRTLVMASTCFRAVVGVSFSRKREKKNKKAYRAHVTVAGKKLRIESSYRTAEDAALAYDLIAQQIFGQAALLNFPDQVGVVAGHNLDIRSIEPLKIIAFSFPWMLFVRIRQGPRAASSSQGTSMRGTGDYHGGKKKLMPKQGAPRGPAVADSPPSSIREGGGGGGVSSKPPSEMRHNYRGEMMCLATTFHSITCPAHLFTKLSVVNGDHQASIEAKTRLHGVPRFIYLANGAS